MAGLVLAPGGLPAGAVHRPGPLQHRALKPELDKLIVASAAGRLRLYKPQPFAHRERLLQELRALHPGKRLDVIACELEQIERYEMELPRRRDIALEYGSAHRCKVLHGSAILTAERDQFSVEQGPSGASASGARSEPSRSPRLVPRRDHARMRACPPISTSSLNPSHFGSIIQSPCAGHVAARVLSIGSGIAIAGA
jgi:hypothetical protein